ncbi:hypothetical protein BsWGS_12382 [Bradybaena similaris]
MASRIKSRSCCPGEPISICCLALDGREERGEEKPSPDETRAGLDGSDSHGRHAIPIDQGWAWVVCAGCFVITYIMSLYDQVLAVMFLDVVDKFDIPVSTATVVFTIHAFTFSAGSVISTNIIVPKFGVRVVIIIAAVANSLSTIVIAFSPNIAFYLVVHLIKGLSIGSMWIPALGLLGHYFHRCRSVATSITNAGISVSLLITPLFVRELLDNLGFSGTLLVISGVEMQAVAVGMLLRPPSRYALNKRQQPVEPHSLQIIGDGKEQSSLWGAQDAEVRFKTSEGDFSERICSCGFQRSHDSGIQLNQQTTQALDSKSKYEQRESMAYHDDPLVDTTDNRTCNNQITDSKQKINNYSKYTKVNSESEQLSLLSESYVHDSNCPVSGQYENASLLQKSPQDININETQGEMNEHSSVRNQRKSPCMVLGNIFDLNLLRDWLMRILLASTVLGALLQYIPTYIPTLAVQKGVDKTRAAVLLTVCGGVNLVSTLIQGFVIDFKIITAARFVAISQFIVGTMCHLTHVLTSFPTLLLLSVTQGMFGGARMSLMPVVAMDFVGVNNLSKALGFNAMVATLSLSLHHPFLGYLLEKTSSFAVPFHYVGLALYISAVLLLLEPCGRNLNSRRTDREHDN